MKPDKTASLTKPGLVSGRGVFKTEELEPTEVIALEVARTDMHYVVSTLLHAPPELAAAEIALVQYGAMAAYESQLYFARTLGWNLEAEWAPDTAKSARISAKFFADNKRNLDGVVSHFDELLKSNHGAFFPPDRATQFDTLRDDLSVITVDGRPYTSLISAHYLTGLGPTQIASFQEVGPAIGRLSVGIGNIAGALLQIQVSRCILSHRCLPLSSGTQRVRMRCLDCLVAGSHHHVRLRY